MARWQAGAGRDGAPSGHACCARSQARTAAGGDTSPSSGVPDSGSDATSSSRFLESAEMPLRCCAAASCSALRLRLTAALSASSSAGAGGRADPGCCCEPVGAPLARPPAGGMPARAAGGSRLAARRASQYRHHWCRVQRGPSPCVWLSSVCTSQASPMRADRRSTVREPSGRSRPRSRAAPGAPGTSTGRNAPCCCSHSGVSWAAGTERTWPLPAR